MPPAGLSTAIRDTPHSGIRDISNLAAASPGAIRLEVGQPDFRTPDHVVEAGKRALDEGWHGYTPTAGLPTLRERLAAKLERVNGIRVPVGQIICGVGGCGVIANAITALCNHGDEVLLPDPAWPNYRLMVAAIGARRVHYPCPAAGGFLPDMARLEALVSPRTRVLVVNSPNNPSGCVYPPSMLEELGGFAERHGLWIVSDECYDQIVFDGAAVAPGMRAQADPERVVSCFTMSKTYAMTGWRLGYAVAPPAVADGMIKVIEGMTSGTTTVTQKAAEAALDGPQACVDEMVSAYRRRRDLTVELLREAGLLLNVPEGAFYILADVTPSGLDAMAFARRLLADRGVAVAPGTAFGEVARGAVRISLASSDQDLREGVGRLCELVAEAPVRG